MAFRGRSHMGGSFKIGIGGNRRCNHTRDGFFSHHPHRRNVYLTYNYNAVLVMEAILLIICLFIYMYSYESFYIRDPIEKIKTSFLDAQFGGTTIYIMLLILVNNLKDAPSKALKCFIGLFIMAVIFVFSLGIAKLNMDSKYTEEDFTQMYSEIYFKDKDDSSIFQMSLDGSIKQVDRVDIFKTECVNLYRSFTLKVMVGLVIQFVLLLLNIYLIFSVAKSKEKYDEMQKENDVLFDEEQNIKV